MTEVLLGLLIAGGLSLLAWAMREETRRMDAVIRGYEEQLRAYRAENRDLLESLARQNGVPLVSTRRAVLEKTPNFYAGKPRVTVPHD